MLFNETNYFSITGMPYVICPDFYFYPVFQNPPVVFDFLSSVPLCIDCIPEYCQGRPSLWAYEAFPLFRKNMFQKVNEKFFLTRSRIFFHFVRQNLWWPFLVIYHYFRIFRFSDCKFPIKHFLRSCVQFPPVLPVYPLFLRYSYTTFSSQLKKNYISFP